MGICVKCDRCNATFNGNYLESLAGASTGGAEGDDAIFLMVAQARALGWTGELGASSGDDLCYKCSKQLGGQLTLRFDCVDNIHWRAKEFEFGAFIIDRLNDIGGVYVAYRNGRPLSEPVATLLEAKALCEAVYERLKSKGD